MKVRNIALDDNELPEAVTVEMTVREAAIIVRMIGPASGTQLNDFQSDGCQAASDVFDALSGVVFNHFWEAGIGGVAK